MTCLPYPTCTCSCGCSQGTCVLPLGIFPQKQTSVGGYHFLHTLLVRGIHFPLLKYLFEFSILLLLVVVVVVVVLEVLVVVVVVLLQVVVVVVVVVVEVVVMLSSLLSFHE